MLIYLQNKIESLALEAQNIRKKEIRCKRAAVKNDIITNPKTREFDEKRNVARLKALGFKPERISAILNKAVTARNKYPPNDFTAQNMTKFFGLRNHRTIDIRRESRSSNLAYGFLRGRTYNQIEEISFTPPNWERVEQIIKEFGEERQQDLMQRFSEWKENAHHGCIPLTEWLLQYNKLQQAKPGSVRGWTNWSARWKEKHDAKRQEHLAKLKAKPKIDKHHVS